MIYVGNQTVAYPFGWRNDKWLQNVLDIPTGKPIFDQKAQGCSPKECKATNQNRMEDINNDWNDYQYPEMDFDINQAPPKYIENQVSRILLVLKLKINNYHLTSGSFIRLK